MYLNNIMASCSGGHYWRRYEKVAVTHSNMSQPSENIHLQNVPLQVAMQLDIFWLTENFWFHFVSISLDYHLYLLRNISFVFCSFRSIDSNVWTQKY